VKTCDQCGSDLVGKRPHARFCNDACGHAYRKTNVHQTDTAVVFWKAVTRVSSRPTRLTWIRGSRR
jgi:hypothetical protein